MKITFTIPDAKVQRVVAAVNGLFAIPLDEVGKPLFTEIQWAKEKIRRFIVKTVHRYEQKQAQAIVKPDDSLVS